MKITVFLILIYSFVISCTGNNPVAPIEPETSVQPHPVAGDTGMITPVKSTIHSIEIQWRAADDNATPAENLLYQVYYSLSDNLNTVETVEQNGQIAKSWTPNITSTEITGLSHGTRYYINVLVKNKAGHKTAYHSLYAATRETTPPIAATLSIKAAGYTTVQLEWTGATDNFTASENLEYKLVYSANKGDILVKFPSELLGTTAMDWTKNVYKKTIENLSCSTTYYFALVVKDESGNRTLYGFKSTKTKDYEAKFYFENTTGPYKLSNFQMRYSTSDGWTALNIGYPYLSPKSNTTYPSVSPQFRITKPKFWFNVTYIDYNQKSEMEIKNLAPGKIYKILIHEQQITPFLLRFMVVYSVIEVGNY